MRAEMWQCLTLRLALLGLQRFAEAALPGFCEAKLLPAFPRVPVHHPYDLSAQYLCSRWGLARYAPQITSCMHFFVQSVCCRVDSVPSRGEDHFRTS